MKELVHKYTFQPSTNTVRVSGIHKKERFLIITNVSTNTTIYLFNNNHLGLVSISFDYQNNETILVLTYNCSAMSSSDKLQVFIEQDTGKMDFADHLIDPVSKIRVSSPENLIDTDFEYGLQSTKWETLETVNNIPTFFSREGQLSLSLVALDVTNGSKVVTVTSSLDHGFTPGNIVVVKGAALAFADGTYVVATTPSTTVFTYIAKAASPITSSVLDDSTEILLGNLYQGTEFKLEGLGSITSDGPDTSSITVATNTPHGFKVGTNFILTNSLTTRQVTFNPLEVDPNLSLLNQPVARLSDPVISNPLGSIPELNFGNGAGEDPGTFGMSQVAIGDLDQTGVFPISFPPDEAFKFFNTAYKSVWVTAQSTIVFSNDNVVPVDLSDVLPRIDVFKQAQPFKLMQLSFQYTAQALRVRWEGKPAASLSETPTIVYEFFLNSATDEINFKVFQDIDLNVTDKFKVFAFDTINATADIALSEFIDVNGTINRELSFFTSYQTGDTSALAGYSANTLTFQNTSKYQPYRWDAELENFNTRPWTTDGATVIYQSTEPNRPSLYFSAGKAAADAFANQFINDTNHIVSVINNVVTFANNHNLVDQRTYLYTPGILNRGLVIGGTQRNTPFAVRVRTKAPDTLAGPYSIANAGIYAYAGTSFAGSVHNVTATTAGTNRITSTSAGLLALLPGFPIVLNGNIGGLLAGQVYFFKTRVSATQFTVSETVGGADVELTTQTLTVVMNTGGIITDPLKQCVLTARNTATRALTVTHGTTTVNRLPLATDLFGPHALLATSRIHSYAGGNIAGGVPGGWHIICPDTARGTFQEGQPIVFSTVTPTGTTLSTNNFGTAYSTFYVRNLNSPNHTRLGTGRAPDTRDYVTTNASVALIAINAETITVTVPLANLLDESSNLAFNPQDPGVVELSLETISINDHGLVTGDSVTYVVTAGSTAIGGLVANTIYFVIKVDDNTIALATTLANANANTRINLTTTGAGTSHAFSSFAIGVRQHHYVTVGIPGSPISEVAARGVVTNHTGTTSRVFTIKLTDPAPFALAAQTGVYVQFLGSVSRPCTSFNVSTTPDGIISNLSGVAFDGFVVPIESDFNSSLAQRSELPSARTWYSKNHGLVDGNLTRFESNINIVPTGFVNNTYLRAQPMGVDRFRLVTAAGAQIIPTNALGGSILANEVTDFSLSEFNTSAPSSKNTQTWLYRFPAAAVGATSQVITIPTPSYSTSNTTVPVLTVGQSIFTVSSAARLRGAPPNFGSGVTTQVYGSRVKLFDALGADITLADGSSINDLDIRVGVISGTSPAINIQCYVLTPGGIPAARPVALTTARVLLDSGLPCRDEQVLQAGSFYTVGKWINTDSLTHLPAVNRVLVDRYGITPLPRTTLETARISAVSNTNPISITYTYAKNNTVTVESVSRKDNITTLITQVPHGFNVGMRVTVAGVVNTTFNGTVEVLSATAMSLTYAKPGDDTTSVNGTVGQIIPALQPRVAVISNITRESPAVVTTSAVNGFAPGQPFHFINTLGTNDWAGLWDQRIYYIRPLTTTTFAVFKDRNFTIPLDTSTYSTDYVLSSDGGRVWGVGAKFDMDSATHTFTSRVANPESDTIFATSHGFTSGRGVTYSPGDGTPVGGLPAGQVKFVVAPSTDRFQLADTASGFDTNPIAVTQNGTTINITTGVITSAAHGFTTGRLVQYLSNTPAIGLENGAYYYVRRLNATTFSLFWTADAAVNNVTNERVALAGVSFGTGTFRQSTLADITTRGFGDNHTITTALQPGSVDGLYKIIDAAPNGDKTKFRISDSSGAAVDDRVVSLSTEINIDLFNDAFRSPNHGFVTGIPVVYRPGTGSAPLSTLVAEETYFIIKLSNEYFQLAATVADAYEGTHITLLDGISGSGIYELITTSVVGAAPGVGTLTLSAGSTTVIGSGTLFTNFYRNGDTFYWSYPPITNNNTRNVTFVGSTFTNASAAPFNTAHFLNTGMSVLWFSQGTEPTNFVNNNIYYVRFLAANTFTLHKSPQEAFDNIEPISAGGGVGPHTIQVLTVGGTAEAVISTVNSTTKLVLVEPPPAETWQRLPVTSIITTAVNPSVVTVRFPYIPPLVVGNAIQLRNTGIEELDTGEFVVATAVNNTVTFSAVTNLGALTISSPGNTNNNLVGIECLALPTASYDAVSSLLVSSDSAALHRPYDGGVELVPTSSPTARIIRQTRSYFRYQSGKSIQVSFAINFSPTVAINRIVGLSNGKATVKTRLPHRLTVGATVNVSGDTSNNYNGEFVVSNIDNDYTFRIALASNKSEVSSGRPEFYVVGWVNAVERCGLMDDQNGLYFEYDGQTLYAAKRSSTTQIGGSASVTFGENAIVGQDTQFDSELSQGDMIVVKGQSYKVVDIPGPTLMYVQPSYRGTSTTNVVISKTIETRIAQQDWSIDPCDGTGRFGYKLDVNKIQMVYIDYAWYGAGKVRFGVKDQRGNVIYVHEFIHNNVETEAYLRSGNLPARYEVEILENPSFIPSLAHWGTSVIMDGGFDDDKAYLFSATSNPLYTNSAEPIAIPITSVRTTNFVTRTGTQLGDGKFFAFDVTGNLVGEIGFALQVANASDGFYAVGAGSLITNVSGAPTRVSTLTATPTSGRVGSSPYLRGVIVGFTTSNQPIRRNLIVINKEPANRTTSNATVSVTNNFDFTQFIPLLSVRLAPSVDNGTPGRLGAREIINRMQLTLNSLDFLSTHECEIQLVFNASLDNQDYRRVQSPSLSEVVYHSLSDTVSGGAVVYTFQTPSGGQQSSALNTAQRELALTSVDLRDVATLGNSITGGDGVFPDGPDVITLQFRYIGLPGLIGAGTAGTSIAPFRLSTRLSWSESQA